MENISESDVASRVFSRVASEVHIEMGHMGYKRLLLDSLLWLSVICYFAFDMSRFFVMH